MFTLLLAILGSLFVFFLIFLLRTLLRRDWLAATAVVVLVTGGSNAELLGLIAVAFMTAFGMWVLLRFGVLPLVAAAFVHAILLRLPITLDLSAWYSGSSLVALGTILAMSVWSFRAALGGRPSTGEPHGSGSRVGCQLLVDGRRRGPRLPMR